jgi:hypothetical protein
MNQNEQQARIRKGKRFKLPAFNPGISLKEALSQLHLARDFFTIHRDLHCATEVSCASRRYQLALEKAINHGEIDISIALPYLSDISDCINHMRSMQEEFAEKIERKHQRHATIQLTRRTYDIIGYYITLLGEGYHRINDFIRTQTELPDNLRPVDNQKT